jgi:hypothetical protein
MAEPSVINVSDLRIALDRVLQATEDLLGAEVPVQADYYWHLPVERAFDMASEPRDFTAGQLSDDLESVRTENEHVEPVTAWHDLAHLIGVLRALELAARP